MLFKKDNGFLKKGGLCIMATLFAFCSMAQCAITWDEINGIRNNTQASPGDKLRDLYRLKTKAEQCHATADSVYARLLDFIAAIEFENNDYEKSISYALQSLRINRAGGKGTSAYYAMVGYYNAGYYYYLGPGMYDKALIYFDSSLRLSTQFTNANNLILGVRVIQSYILLTKGDFQKCTDECIAGAAYSLSIKDSAKYVEFILLKSQALVAQADINRDGLGQSLSELQNVIPFLKRMNDQYNVAAASKMIAFIYAKTNQLTASGKSFAQGIQARKLSGDFRQVAADYRDLGILHYELGQYREAERNFFIAIEYGRQKMDSFMLASIYINLEQNTLDQSKYREAEGYTMAAMKYLKLNKGETIQAGIKTTQLKQIDDKGVAFTIAGNCTEVLLHLYKTTKDKKYLDACLRSALLTDTVITDMRHHQAAEQSKLYWRNFTRTFFANAMEACFLANDVALAFRFMEKSSAVLLNDKLKEIGASASLPAAEADMEETLRINVIEQRQKLSRLSENTDAFNKQQEQTIQAGNDLENFIKTLEKKYPLYYQYKYADDVPSLKTLQEFLANNKQSFVHYFITDTSAYVLAITSAGTQLRKLSKNEFSSEQLIGFLQLSSDKQALNKQYTNYAGLSHDIYKKLFELLHIPKGRVIICADNFLIPFEALATDATGKNFLLYDYAFSYVYSARYMLNKANDYTAKNDFLGIAPVSFASYLQLPDLKQSENAIKKSAAFYNGADILANGEASRKNFLKQLPNYAIVNIFSHASADSSHDEPILCMNDSIIYLSQLQLINNPATKLVVLSACETNAGKRATGEGIYSLARGFALVGIPSVSATLWKADETSIYAITELFNRNLSKGMTKDEALQQAKISFLKGNNNEKQLPYYWSNIILVGNTAPLKLSAGTYWWWWIGGIVGLMIIIFVARSIKKSSLFR
jgi:CHAT domain-containing protein